MDPAPKLNPPQWAAPRSILVAWLALAVLNALVLAVGLPHALVKTNVRLLHHAYDFGHLCALGVASFFIAFAWQRWARGPRWLGLTALWLAAFGVALLVLRDDLQNFLQRHRFGPTWLSYAAISALVGVAAPATWWLARRLARPWLRWVAVGAGLAIGIANHRVLPFAYPGLHLVAAWIAALAVAGALCTLPLGERARAKRGRIAAVVGLAVCTTAGVLALVVVPSRSVWRELFRSPGTVLAPLLVRALPARAGGYRPLPIEGSPWFRDRSGLAPIAPATARVAPDAPILIFLTIDALRPELAKKHADRLPALAKIRARSLSFTNARSPSPSTVTTIISIFTGKYYSSLYWSAVDATPFKGMFKGAIMPHEDPSPRIAGLLDQAGVKTVHVVPLWGLGRELGVGQGFSEELLTRRDYGHADEVMKLLIDRLRAQGNSPLFMYTHFVDPHAPYDLAGTHGTEYERYLREMELVDRELGKLLEVIAAPELAKRVILIVSADHGEAFGEHGTQYHALTLYEELVRVPLYVVLPGAAPRSIEQPVTLMDLGPTILHLFGVAAPPEFMGESLVPLLQGKSVTLTRPIACDAGRRIQALYFPDGKKAIVDLKRSTEELYDLRTDPGELENLIDSDHAEPARHLNALRTFFQAHRLKRNGYEPPWRPF